MTRQQFASAGYKVQGGWVRRSLLVLACILLLAILVVVAGAIWLGSASGLAFLLDRTERSVVAAGGRFDVTGASGGLYRGVTFERVEWSDGKTQVNAEGIAARWSLRSVLRREVVVPDVSISQVTVRLPPGDETAEQRTDAIAFPERIGLPVSFELTRFKLDSLKLVSQTDGIDPSPVEPLEVTNVRFGLDYQDGAYNLRDMQATLPWGDVSETRVSLNDTNPHAIVFRGQFDGALDAHPVSVKLAALGSIKGLNSSIKGEFDQSPLSVDIRLRPLEPNPVVSATGWIRKLDLGRLEPPLPKTAIDLDFDLLNPRALPRVEEVPDSAELKPVAPPPANGQGSAAWQGSISLANAASGPLHEKLLPLLSLSADLQLDATAKSEPTRLLLSNLKLEIPGAKTLSTVSGAVNVLLNENHRVAGSVLPVIVAGLQFRNIDVAQFIDDVAPTAMNGNFDLTRDLFNLDLTQSEGPLRQAVTLPGGGKAVVRTSGRISDDAVHLDSALIQLDKSQLTASGRATLTEPIALAMGGSLTNVELATWIPRSVTIDERFRNGQVNADWTVDGVVSPAFDAQVSLNLKKSSLMGHPLSGRVRGKFRLPTDEAPLDARNVDSQLRLGSNVISVNGSLGREGDAMRLSGLLADPALIDPRVSGTVNLKAVVTGTPSTMQTRLNMTSKRLQWRDPAGETIVVQAAQIKAQMPVVTAFADNVPVNLDLQAGRVRVAGRQFDGVKLDVAGTASRHSIDGQVRVNRHLLAVQADGRLTAGNQLGWNGTINTLSSKGKVRARLQQPVAVDISPRVTTIDRVRLSILDGLLALDRIQFAPGGAGAAAGGLSVAGRATDLPVGGLVTLAAESAGAGNATTVPAELDRLRIDADFDLSGSSAEDLSGRFDLELKEVGAVTPARSQQTAGGIGLSGKNGARIRLQSGQLSGNVDLTLPSLAFSRRFTGDEWVVDGRLRLVSVLGGTLRSPSWDARLYGTGLSLFQPALGWRFSRGQLEAQVAGDQLTLTKLSLDSGDGRVSVNGSARLLRDAGSVATTGVLPLDGRFTLRCDGLVIPIGPGQRLVLTGDSALASTRAGLTWTGSLRADEGLIEIAGSGAPSLPGDVLIQDAAAPGPGKAGAKENNAEKKAQTTGGQSPKVRTELSIDLGEKLRIAGGGVKARLTGKLRLHGELPDAPQVTGDVIIRDGTYFAYNQELTIERGAVRFAGPLDNPLLDIVAIRPDLPVKAGVALGGTALSPKVQLTSTPPLSDAETLSWVVLGTPLANAQEGAQSLALKQAAAAFIGSDDGSLSGGGLSDSIGVDVGFGYASDTGQSDAVTDAGSPTGLPGSSTGSTVQANEKVFTLGKKLSDRLSVSYEKSLEGVWNLLRLQYEISNRLSLRAQTGTESALDLIYFFTFD